MVNFDKVKQNIAEKIIENTDRLIGGQKLQDVLINMTSASEMAQTESIARDEEIKQTETSHTERLSAIEQKNLEQDNSIIAIQGKDKEQDVKLDGIATDLTDIKHKDSEQDGRLDAIEAKDNAQDTEIAKKANTEDVNAKNLLQDNEIAKKADTSAVNEKNAQQDEQIALKANSSDVNAKIAETDANVVKNAQDIAKKADKTTVDGQLELKADKTEVEASLATKGEKVEQDALICSVDKGGHETAISYNALKEIKICNYPLVVFGHGTPSAANMIDERMKPLGGSPAFTGQFYINLDASERGLYYAKGSSSVSDWVNA